MNSKTFIRILFILVLGVSVNATTCSKSYTLGFFNGVWNTDQQALDGARELKTLIGTTYNNEPIYYESFYNHTGSSVGATALQDIAETFIQRSAEIDASGELGRRFEYFWEFIGSSEPTFIDKIKGIFSNAIALFDSLFTTINTKLVAIISYFASNPPTEADYATHNVRLDTLAADGQKLMLVGHSQGNLFMNHGYDHILPTVGVDRVKAAHIAPASPTLRGDWLLANIDLVINALRIQGANSVPDNNLDINTSRVDVSGHTLIGTYLDPVRDGRRRVKTMIEGEMGRLRNCLFDHTSIVHIYKSLLIQECVRRDINEGSYFSISLEVSIPTQEYISRYFEGYDAYSRSEELYKKYSIDEQIAKDYVKSFNKSNSVYFMENKACFPANQNHSVEYQSDMPGCSKIIYTSIVEQLSCNLDVYRR